MPLDEIQYGELLQSVWPPQPLHTPDVLSQYCENASPVPPPIHDVAVAEWPTSPWALLVAGAATTMVD